MGIAKPFHRTVRAVKPGPNAGYSSWAYIRDPAYAKEPSHYVRAYLLIQQDLQKLFEFIEPSEEGLGAFSYRTHELLMRTCIELEANFKAILDENGYEPKRGRYGDMLNINTYRLIDASHRLSSYRAILPIWNGPRREFKPFEKWKGGGKLDWYAAYNASKHDRHRDFRQANLGNLLLAVSALLIVLTSQFKFEDFSAGGDTIGMEGHDLYELEPAIGSLFRIGHPDDWLENEKYDFDWSELKSSSNRFLKFDYNALEVAQNISDTAPVAT